jgi:hypothetical protein
VTELERHFYVALCRYVRAFYVLVVMPLGLAETIADPSRYHLILLGVTVAETACAGALHRTAARRWAKGGGR